MVSRDDQDKKPYNLREYEGFELIEHEDDEKDGLKAWELKYNQVSIAYVRVSNEGIRIEDLDSRDGNNWKKLLTPLNGRTLVFSLYYTISNQSLSKLEFIDLRNIWERSWFEKRSQLAMEHPDLEQTKGRIVEASSKDETDQQVFEELFKKTNWGKLVIGGLKEFEDLKGKSVKKIELYKADKSPIANSMKINIEK